MKGEVELRKRAKETLEKRKERAFARMLELHREID
jgi:hypothetical protein